MVLVNSRDIAFQFPVVVTFGDGERWICREADDLTRVTPVQVKMGRYRDLQIVDASQRRWVARSFRKIGRADPWTFLGMLFLPTDWRVEYMLEELPPVERKKRAAARKPRKPPLQRAPKPLVGGGRTKASETDFLFPLAGFTKKAGVLLFGELTYLTHCYAADVVGEALIGMELVDNRQRRWIVRSLTLDQPLPKKRWWQLSAPFVAFDLILEEVDPIDLQDLKSRLLKDWELEFFDDEEAVRAASDLAMMVEKSNMQATGLY